MTDLTTQRFAFAFDNLEAANDLFSQSATPLSVAPFKGTHFDVACDNLYFAGMNSYRSGSASGVTAIFSDDTRYFTTSVRRSFIHLDKKLVNRSLEYDTDFRNAHDRHIIAPNTVESGYTVLETHLRHVIEQQIGEVCSRIVAFETAGINPSLHLTCEAICDIIHAGTKEGGPLENNTLAIASLKDALVNTVLHGAKNNYSGALMRGSIELPRVLRRAVDYMHAHASQPISTTDVAVGAGMSIRSLQLSFREWMDTTPQLYLRMIRLRAARDYLLQNPESEIRSVAKIWGFRSSGEFAQLFQREFGVLPSKLRG